MRSFNILLLFLAFLAASDLSANDPVKPTGVYASDGNFGDKIQITWNVSNASSYQVFRCSTDQDSSCSQIATLDVNSTTHDDFGASADGTVHYYRVKACNDLGCSQLSEYDTGYRLADPKKPTGVSASDGTFEDKVQITWNVSNASSYRVFRCETFQDSSCIQIATQTVSSNHNGTTYDDFGADDRGVPLYYRIKACNQLGCSQKSEIDTGYRLVPPVKPTEVSASDYTFQEKVRITWTLFLRSGFQVFRCSTDEVASCIQIATVDEDSTAATCGLAKRCYLYSDDFGADAHPAVHYYRVKACNALGCSQLSEYDTGAKYPYSPTSVRASGNFGDKVQIKWNVNKFASSYQVFRCSTDEVASCSSITTPDYSSTTYDDFGASADGTVHYYRVKACYSAGCSDFSEYDTGFRLRSPVKPTGVSASDGTFEDKVQITWNVSNASSYQVFRCSTSQDSSCIQIATQTVSSNHNSTTYDDFGLSNGAVHYYRVKTCNDLGCSQKSEYDTGYRLAPPVKPTGVSASDGTFRDKVQITWNVVSVASSYQVFRCSTAQDSSCSSITTPDHSSTTYDDFAADANGAVHYYRVKACNNAGCSQKSEYADAGYRLAPDPVKPTGVSASDGTFDDKVQITWNVVSVASSYQVFRCSTDEDSSCSPWSTPDYSSTTFDDFGADWNGAVHYYRVKACNNAGCSQKSEYDTGYRRVNAPGKPTVSASDGTYTDKVRITWPRVSDTYNYQVFRCSTTSTDSCTEIAIPRKASHDDFAADANGAVHYYRVKACNSAGCSAKSEYDTGYRNADPVKPTGVSASDGTFRDKVQITWNVVSVASSYQVFRCSTDQDASCGQIATQDDSSTTYDDFGADAEGAVHYYRVKACNAQGCSQKSEYDTGYREGVLHSMIFSDGFEP